MSDVRVQHAKAAHQPRSVGDKAVSVSKCALIHQQFLGREILRGLDIIAETIGRRFEYGERLHIGHLLRCVRASRRERNLHALPCLFRRCLDGGTPAKNDNVPASETFFLPDCDLLNSVWIFSRTGSTFASSAGWLTSQSFCGARRMRAPFLRRRGFVRAAEIVDAEAHAVLTSCEIDNPGSEDFAFELSDVLRVDQLVINLGHRVLPQLGRGNQLAEQNARFANSPYLGA